MKRNWLKFVVGWTVCMMLRLIPYRPPNIEPILATNMPFGKQYGNIAGFFFSFLSIIIFDFLTAKVGMWTIITAVTYGVVGFGAGMFFKKYKSSIFSYATYAIIGTLFFDAVTGLSIGPLFFGQSFSEAFFGQVPFTGLHLLGNVFLAVTVSPLIERWVLRNKYFEPEYYFSTSN